MSAKPMSQNQIDTALTLSNYVGETVDVQTSQYTHSGSGKPLYPETWKPKTIATLATLKGLETRGYIRIVETFWRGATVEVLKSRDF